MFQQQLPSAGELKKRNNFDPTGSDVMVLGVGGWGGGVWGGCLISVCVFEELPGGRYPHSELL